MPSDSVISSCLHVISMGALELMFQNWSLPLIWQRIAAGRYYTGTGRLFPPNQNISNATNKTSFTAKLARPSAILTVFPSPPFTVCAGDTNHPGELTNET